MEKIIFIRPSDCNKTNDSLTGEGYGKVFDLVQRFRHFIDTSRKTIISSPDVRARATSSLLAWYLDIAITEFPHEQFILGTAMYSKSISDNEKICRLVEKIEVNTDVLIIVTHELQISSFPNYYSKKWLWRSCSFASLEPGEALILNCKKAETVVFNQPFNMFV